MEDMGTVITTTLLDDKIDGRIKCYVNDSTCIGYRINRADLDLCNEIEELKQSGIYFLFGGNEDKSTKDVVYIGQANCRKNGNGILSRLKEKHPQIKYWTEAVAFTSLGNILCATELNYLENLFCTLVTNTNRYIVKNGNSPSVGNYTNETKYSVKNFIHNTKLILGTLNYKIFVPIIEEQNNDNIFYFKRKNRKTGIIVNAQCQKTREGFVVLKGSYIHKEDMKNIPATVKIKREIAKINKNRILQEDILFNSPSYAAAFVIGGNTNGKTDWKTKDGIPLKNYEK